MIVIIVAILSVLIATAGTLRIRYRALEMQHQERMAALEKGIQVVPASRPPAPWSPRVYLLRGLIWSLIGIVLTAGLVGMALTPPRPYPGMGMEKMMTKAKGVSQNLGISMNQALDVVKDDEDARRARQRVNEIPMAFAVFGLIPFGVGVAYLIFYYTDESRKRHADDTRSEVPPSEG